MKNQLLFPILAAVILWGLSGIVGCQGEQVSEKTKAEGDKLAEIRERTGYSWDKATDTDKKFLMDTCQGNEGCAKNLLYKPKPGGPGRRPQPGGGPPPPPAPGGN